MDEEEEKPELEPVFVPSLTPAELRHLERKRKTEEARLEKLASKTHKERVREFNEHLGSLSEHHDIPK